MVESLTDNTVDLLQFVIIDSIYSHAPIHITDRIDFMRDIIAFMVVIGTVVAVAFDGAVRLII